MAIDLSTILQDRSVRPYHLAVPASVYTGQTEDAYTSYDNTTAIVTAKTDAHAAIEANVTDTDEATATKTAVDAIIDTLLAVNTVNKSAVLAAIKTELDTLIAADTDHFPYIDIWCQGTGQYEKRRDAGADPTDATLKHCDVCDGFGRKMVQDEIVMIKPSAISYP